MRKKALVFLILLALAAAYWLFAMPEISTSGQIPKSEAAVERGEYLVAAGGCRSCHMAEDNPEVLSGGLALKSDFGTFYAPNITPDPGSGIGAWTSKDFLLALKHGRKPGGGFYFPAFPFRAYAGLSDAEVLDIAAYLMAQPAFRSDVPEHETPAWLSSWMMAAWNRLADFQQPKLAIPTDPIAARGAYLARNLGHCGECHTPRNGLGIPDLQREFAGARLDGKDVEPIDQEALENWTVDDFDFFLFVGMAPDGDSIGGKMEAVIEHNTSKLTAEDRDALAAFFKRSL